MAKYVIQWKNRDALAGDEDAGKRLLDLYTKWTPAAPISLMVSNIDGNGGLSVVETDNPLDIMRDVTKFETYLEFTVTQVVDITDAVPVFNEALDYVASMGNSLGFALAVVIEDPVGGLPVVRMAGNCLPSAQVDPRVQRLEPLVGDGDFVRLRIGRGELVQPDIPKVAFRAFGFEADVSLARPAFAAA